VATALPQGITKQTGKRGDTWRVRWQGPTRQETKTFKTEQAALDWHALVNADRVHGKRTTAPARRMTFDHFAADVFATGRWAPTRGSARSTRDQRERHYRVHLAPAFAHVPLAAITRADVQTFVDGLCATLAPNSVRSVFWCLSAILHDAHHAGHVAHVATDGVALPGRARPVGFAEDDEGEPMYLTAEQVERLADATADAFRAWVYIGAYCGLRLGEVLALRWSDLELDGARPHVKVRRILARSTDGPYLSPSDKAGKGARRDVPIPPGDVLGELLAHRDRAAAAGVAVTGRAAVFPPPRGGALWHDSTWRSHVWRPALARAEGVSVKTVLAGQLDGKVLPANVTPHWLRHTAVSLWIAAGHEPRTVSKRAGHASIAFTYDTYGGLFPETGDGADAQLDLMARTARRSVDATAGAARGSRHMLTATRDAA
jgi:integrase